MGFGNQVCAQFVALAVAAASLPVSSQESRPMVSARYTHALALHADGRVFAWGNDQSGQLGQGSEPFQTRPGRIAGLGPAQSVAAGSAHSLALHADGSVWGWGSNSEGQLGDGSLLGHTSTPVRAAGLAGVTEICGGGAYSLALRADGSVWAWGANHNGELGRGDDDERSTVPTRVPGLPAAARIACGDSHALALARDGSVFAWGSNLEGELGSGGTGKRALPARVPGLGSAVAVAAGMQFSSVLTADGAVWEWGVASPYAEPRGAPRTRPVRTEGLGPVSALVGAVGSFQIVAVGIDGASWWRWTASEAPVPQPPVGPIAALAAGYGQSFFVKTDGTVLGFGAYAGNGFGNLGDGTTLWRSEPAPVVDLSRAVRVASGIWHGLALDAAGGVWSWGLDVSGQLGRSRGLSRSIPTPVPGLAPVAQVSAGGQHSLAVTRDGQVWAWGSNGYAQLDGTWRQDSGVPVRVEGIGRVRSAEGGALYSLVLRDDGSVWGWGSALPGGDGDGLVQQLHHGAVAITAGGLHALALGADGSVWAWGDNGMGQLGDGTRQARARPARIAGLPLIQAIAAGLDSSYALGADGSVWAWGNNDRGQLGGGPAVQRSTPARVVGLSEVVELSAGPTHALVRRRDGAIWGWRWAYDNYGEMGETAASNTDPLPPGPLATGVGDVTGIAAGESLSALLRADGTLYLGGLNADGQRGDGTYALQPGFTGVVDPQFSGFLDLDMNPANLTVPADKVPPFFIGTYRSGAISALTLKAELRGLGASVQASLVSGALRQSAAVRGYDVFVAAYVPALGASGVQPILMMHPTRAWAPLAVPIAAFMNNVALNSPVESVVLTLFERADFSESMLDGTELFIGYGTDADEMLRSARFRKIMTLRRTSP